MTKSVAGSQSEADQAPAIDRPLAGERVAVAGRLASMSRRDAARLIAALGGRMERRVSALTTLVVIGRHGLPLSSRGVLSSNLAHIGALWRSDASIRTISEEEFLDCLGHRRHTEQVHKLCTSEELISLLQISRPLLASWLRTGLIKPVDEFHSLQYFDFVQVSTAKKLTQLAHAGVGPRQIRRSLQQLAKWLPGIETPLLQLQVLERNGPLLVRTAGGQLAEPSGQLHFEMESPDEDAAELVTAELAGLAQIDTPRSADEWFERGCECEDAGQLADAAEAFRQALLVGGPDAETVFNLANVLFAQGLKREACERFRQAVEIEPTFVDAWNNLGIALAELKHCDQALWAYRQALQLDPHYADAHYNLAECLYRNGCFDDAQIHWQQYLRHDTTSEWASYAQQCLRSPKRDNAD